MQIAKALSDVSLLCIEAAPFIYYTESRPIYVDKMREIFRLMNEGQFEVLSSTIALSECLTKPLKEKDQFLVSEFSSLFENTYWLTLIPVDMAIARQSAVLRAKYGLKTPDALHMATALESGCHAFLTNDLGLKRVSEIRVLVLDELEVN